MIKLKSVLVKTQYLWGAKSDIAGKELRLLERNNRGNCLCIMDKGLVDVDKEDIQDNL